MTTSSTAPPTTTEPAVFRALRVVAACEGVSFVLLLVCSVLKRTTGPDLVPVMGSVHGLLFVSAVLLVLTDLPRLRWGWLFTLVMLTVGSPGLHFPVRATHAGSPDPRPAL